MKSKVRDTREDPTNSADVAKATLFRDLRIQPNVEYACFEWDYWSLAPGSRAADPENCPSENN